MNRRKGAYLRYPIRGFNRRASCYDGHHGTLEHALLLEGGHFEVGYFGGSVIFNLFKYGNGQSLGSRRGRGRVIVELRMRMSRMIALRCGAFGNGSSIFGNGRNRMSLRIHAPFDTELKRYQ